MRRAAPDTIVQAGDLAIRRMRDGPADYRLMATWLTDPRILELYEGRDQPYPYECVVQKYAPRVRGDDPVCPCILVHLDREIGYLQYYPVASAADYELDDAEGVYGVDMFIGEPEHWDRGIGTRALSAIVSYIFGELKARRVVIDPRVDNGRAIRAYERAGFRKVKVLPGHELHEGARADCWLMVVER